MNLTRRSLLLCFPVLAAAAGLWADTPVASGETLRLTVAEVPREALVFAAESAGPAAKQPRPLVFFFHGHGGTARHAARTVGVQQHWPEAVVVYPQGLTGVEGITDPEGKKTGWQKNVGQQGDRDVAFFDAMLASLQKKYAIDPARIYVMGHSNGSRFSCVLWNQRGNKLAAICSSGGHGLGLARTAPKLPMFMIAGKKDEIVSYKSQFISVVAAKAALGAQDTKVSTTGHLSLYPCENGLELATYLHPGGHAYPAEVVPDIVKFMKRNPRKQKAG